MVTSRFGTKGVLTCAFAQSGSGR